MADYDNDNDNNNSITIINIEYKKMAVRQRFNKLAVK